MLLIMAQLGNSWSKLLVFKINTFKDKKHSDFCEKKLKFEITFAQLFPVNGNTAPFCYCWKAFRSNFPNERSQMTAKTLTSGQSLWRAGCISQDTYLLY